MSDIRSTAEAWFEDLVKSGMYDEFDEENNVKGAFTEGARYILETFAVSISDRLTFLESSKDEDSYQASKEAEYMLMSIQKVLMENFSPESEDDLFQPKTKKKDTTWN